jgi:hypothetical protein
MLHWKHGGAPGWVHAIITGLFACNHAVVYHTMSAVCEVAIDTTAREVIDDLSFEDPADPEKALFGCDAEFSCRRQPMDAPQNGGNVSNQDFEVFGAAKAASGAFRGRDGVGEWTRLVAAAALERPPDSRAHQTQTNL